MSSFNRDASVVDVVVMMTRVSLFLSLSFYDDRKETIFLCLLLLLGVFFLFVCFLKEGGPFLRPSLFGIVWVGPRMHIQKFFSFPFFVFLFTSVSAFAFGP